MRIAKDIAFMSVFTALLIGGQLILSGISGVEIVTVLFLTYAFVFGVKRSVTVAVAFSLLRCLLFGFFPTVVLLYLIYYPLFAVVIGGIGNVVRHKWSWKIQLVLVGVAVLLTLAFTALDNVITPLFYRYTKEAAIAYAYASFTACIPQVVCAVVTVALLFPVLYKVTLPFKN